MGNACQRTHSIVDSPKTSTKSVWLIDKNCPHFLHWWPKSVNKESKVDDSGEQLMTKKWQY